VVTPEVLARCCPKGYIQNLRFRRWIIDVGYESEENAEQLREMCARSFTFFANAFLWTLDPRSSKDRKRPSAVPFILYPFQERDAETIEECIETGQDVVVSKSRDMGASWLILLVFLWRWLFREDQTFLCASRTKEYVDATGNPKALFQKLDFAIERLPTFLLPKRGKGIGRTFMTLRNEENGSVINGESTTGNLGRGDRRTSIMIDEFAAFEVQDGFDALASTRDVTPCRIFNSTISRQRGAFDTLLDDPDRCQIRMHWTDHPVKAIGLYRDAAGKVRSPWYDAECKRCVTAQEIACEIDMDRAAASNSFFTSEDLNMAAQHCRIPWKTGDVRHDELGRFVGWEDTSIGLAEMWVLPDASGAFPRDRNYIVAVDVSSGTGSSNSTISVFDDSTGEQLLEWVSPHVRPDRLAPIACAIGRWFGGSDGEATMVFENQGPGLSFHSACRDLEYRRFYIRRREDQRNTRMTEFVGVFVNGGEKVRQWGNFRRMWMEGRIVIRSRRAVEECRNIVYMPTGEIAHSGTRSTDPSSARANHGDRASACCIAAVAMSPAARGAKTPMDERPPSPFMQRWMDHERRMAEEAAEAW
jgi:hypothetical protein